MIPNKIYVVEYLNETFYHRWQEEKYNGNYAVNHEYISKDTLIKWLESNVYQHNEDRFDDGFNTAIGQVIDKINSL